MKTTIKYLAPWLAAAAIGGALALAPVASANPGWVAVPQSKAVNTPAPSPTHASPAPTPFETGTDPLVPPNGGANPYVPYFPGMGQAF